MLGLYCEVSWPSRTMCFRLSFIEQTKQGEVQILMKRSAIHWTCDNNAEMYRATGVPF